MKKGVLVSGSRTEYPTSGIPNNGMLSNYVRYNMWWVFCPCLTGIPNDGIRNNGMSSNYIRYNM